jgi:hypothetical protein
MKIRAVLLMVLTALASCASQPPAAPSQEILDESDASTLLVAAKTTVFARER